MMSSHHTDRGRKSHESAPCAAVRRARRMSDAAEDMLDRLRGGGGSIDNDVSIMLDSAVEGGVLVQACLAPVSPVCDPSDIMHSEPNRSSECDWDAPARPSVGQRGVRGHGRPTRLWPLLLGLVFTNASLIVAFPSVCLRRFRSPHALSCRYSTWGGRRPAAGATCQLCAAPRATAAAIVGSTEIHPAPGRIPERSISRAI